jgi:hypothetical protein
MTLPPAAPFDERSKNKDDWSFAYGRGCTDATTATYSGSGAPTGFCTEPKIAGIASCFSYLDSVTNYNYYGSNATYIVPADRGIQGQDTKPHLNCYCKITWPIETRWLLASTYVSESACKAYCIDYCYGSFNQF